MDRLKTYYGDFSFADISSNEIDLRDIVISMIQSRRYGGHSHISENAMMHATHTLDVVSRIVGGVSSVAALNILLHDVAKVYTGELLRPFSTMVDNWTGGKVTEMREEIRQHVFASLGIEYVKEIHDYVDDVVHGTYDAMLSILWSADVDKRLEDVLDETTLTVSMLMNAITFEKEGLIHDENSEQSNDK